MKSVFSKFLLQIVFGLFLVAGVLFSYQSAEAASTCGFRCSVTMSPSAMNCNPRADSAGVPTVTSLPCSAQCNSVCRRLGMARDTGATPTCVDPVGLSGDSHCGACTCIPQSTILCSGSTSIEADRSCATSCGTTCSRARVSQLESGEGISCVTSGSSAPSCVTASRTRSEGYCRACLAECRRGGAGTSMTDATCLTVCNGDTLYNVCQGFTAADLGFAPATASGSGSGSGRSSSGSGGGRGTTGASTGSAGSGSNSGSGSGSGSPAAASQGTCNFTCQPQTTPTTCTSDTDCTTPCQQVCGRSFRNGQCVTSGPGAARCAPAATPGATRQCAFECSIGASAQERSCNPQGTDDQAPARVCGSFCEPACQAASTQRFTGTPRVCASTAATCVGAGGAGGAGSPGSGTPGTGTDSGGSPGSSGSNAGSSGNSGNGATQSLGGNGASGGGSRLTNPLTGIDSIAGLVGRLIKGILGIVGSLALLMFIYGGVRWILSAGDPKDVTAAQNILRNATIGMILIFFSYSISSVILGFLSEIGGASSGNTGSSSSSGQAHPLATCVQYAVEHGHLGRNEAMDRTTASWACRETQATERNNTAVCIRNGCPSNQGNSATTLCCAPLTNTRTPLNSPTTTPPPTAPGAGGAGGGGGPVTPPAWTRENYCRELAGAPAGSPCQTCLNACLTRTVCTPGGVTYIGGRMTSQNDVNGQTENCRIGCSMCSR